MRPIEVGLIAIGFLFARELWHIVKEELIDFRLRRLEEEDEYLPEGWKPVPMDRVKLIRKVS